VAAAGRGCATVTAMPAIPDLHARVTRAGRWLVGRSPMSILVAGWIGFGLLAYPGYLSYSAIEQFGEARIGTYSDAHPVLATVLWSYFGRVIAGPAPMLALQSGMFLFGLAAVFRRVMSPRAASAAAVATLLAPPVYAVMAAIWNDSLAAAALLAAAGCFVDGRRASRIAGVVCLVLACNCRPGFVVAAPAILALAFTSPGRRIRWRAVAQIAAISAGCAAAAQLASDAFEDDEVYPWTSQLQVMDIGGTARRADLDEADFDRAFDGVEIVDRVHLARWIAQGHDQFDYWPLVYGEARVFAPVGDDDDAAAVGYAWRRMIVDHPVAYLRHRVSLARHALGLDLPPASVFDDFGDPKHLVALQHRADASAIQRVWRHVIRVLGRTFVFKPWLYLAGAIVALVTARDRVVRLVVASGLCYEAAQFFLADSIAASQSHWLVTTAWVGAFAWLGARWWPPAQRAGHSKMTTAASAQRAAEQPATA
jgi:hypothetical protein